MIEARWKQAVRIASFPVIVSPTTFLQKEKGQNAQRAILLLPLSVPYYPTFTRARIHFPRWLLRNCRTELNTWLIAGSFKPLPEVSKT